MAKASIKYDLFNTKLVSCVCECVCVCAWWSDEHE